MPRPLRTVCRISIHALREEGDSAVYGIWVLKSNFYPRPPRGGRHTSCAPCPGLSSFLSTPSARRATHESLVRVVVLLISIHALREEGDAQLKKRQTVREKFLSTPSARRATWSAERSRHRLWNFYPRPPRGGRRMIGVRQQRTG